jgi:hypothetical protein
MAWLKIGTNPFRNERPPGKWKFPDLPQSRNFYKMFTLTPMTVVKTTIKFNK